MLHTTTHDSLLFLFTCISCYLSCYLIHAHYTTHIHLCYACTHTPALPARYVGVYVGDTKEDDQSLFITERHCFQDLLSGLASACPCGLAVNAWIFVSAVQVWSRVLLSQVLHTHTQVFKYQSSLTVHRKPTYFVYLLYAVVVGRAGSGPAQDFLVDII